MAAPEAEIRTKTDRWRSALSPQLLDLLEELRNRRITRQAYQSRLIEKLAAERLAASLAPEIEEAMAMEGQLELLRRHVGPCRHTVLLYRVDEGEAHPPHQHFNLISTQVVLRGHIHIREYERIGRAGPGRVTLELVREAVLGPGDVFNASEWERNLHWFCAVGGPALIFNINARGYEPSTFVEDADRRFGRIYVDPTRFLPDGTVDGEEIAEAEAEARFAGHALSRFPVPAAVAARAGAQPRTVIPIE